ncbi:RdRp [Pineapple mealybug wilt-associated virus 6]|nr:RdRp [Pineapple mealybug wilt-associated virus 6]WCR39360.1 RdRp [Pineapple mealybug wilt-associated virus 6]
MNCCILLPRRVAFETYERFSVSCETERTLIEKMPTMSCFVVNSFLEDLLNGCTAFDFEFFEDDFETTGQEFLVDTLKISDNFGHFKTVAERRYRSFIRSHVGLPKRNTLKCNLVTFENRNFNADRGCNVGCDDNIAQALCDLFFKEVVDASRLAQCQSDRISSNEFLLGEWLEKRTPQAYKSLKAKLPGFVFSPDLMTRYTLMVKSDAKPKLDDTPLYKYVTGQNIVYHDRCVTALFSCIFSAVAERLKFVVDSRWTLYHGMDTVDLARRVKADIGDIRKYHTYELDISKYDKSQASLMKQVEELILLTLGVDKEVLETFFCGEYDSIVRLMTGELSLSIGSQRRSGGANTWLGNTIVLCVLLSVMLEGKDYSYVVVSGDDSLIFSLEELDLDTNPLSDHYGFDVKLFRQSTPYFCSKFFVQTDDYLGFVPDPLKLFVKLGSSRAPDIDLLHEIFTSFVDVTKGVTAESTVQALTDMVTRKYGYSTWTYAALCVIHVLRANFSQFCRLYYDDRVVTDVRPSGQRTRLSSIALWMKMRRWKMKQMSTISAHSRHYEKK